MNALEAKIGISLHETKTIEGLVCKVTKSGDESTYKDLVMYLNRMAML